MSRAGGHVHAPSWPEARRCEDEFAASEQPTASIIPRVQPIRQVCSICPARCLHNADVRPEQRRFRTSALSTLDLGVATVARPWESRTLASAATQNLSLDKALASNLQADQSSPYVPTPILYAVIVARPNQRRSQGVKKLRKSGSKDISASAAASRARWRFRSSCPSGPSWFQRVSACLSNSPCKAGEHHGYHGWPRIETPSRFSFPNAM